MEHQISVFDLLEEHLSWFEQNLLRGSGFVEGKKRLYEAAVKMDDKDFSAFCKKEYGIGGWSIDNGFLWHDSKGLIIENRSEKKKETYNWLQVAKCIKKLIVTGQYIKE